MPVSRPLPSPPPPLPPPPPMPVIVAPQSSRYQPWLVDPIRPLPQIPPPANIYGTSPPPRSRSHSRSSASPSPSPSRPTLPLVSNKRPRMNSQSFGCSSTTPIPISWASRPVDLKPAGNAASKSAGSYSKFSTTVPRRQIAQIPASTPSSASAFTSTFASGASTSSSTSAGSSNLSPQSRARSRSHSVTRPGMRKERSLDGYHLNAARMKLTVTPPPPPPSAPASSSVGPHLGLSFARLAPPSAPSVQTQGRVQRIQTGTLKVNDSTATNPNTHRPPFRPSLHNASPNPIVTSRVVSSTIGVNTSKLAPTPTPAVGGGVIVRPTIAGPRGMATGQQKQKLQLSLQIPAIPVLGVVAQQPGEEEQSQERRQQEKKKPQLPVLKLVTNNSINTNTNNIKLSSPSPSPSKASPISSSAISYMSYPHSPKRKSAPSPSQLSPAHSSLFSADSKLHLHPLSPVSLGGSTTTTTTHTGSGTASARTSVSIRGWIVGGATGGAESPGGRSVKSFGGTSTKSVGARSDKSRRSNKKSAPASVSTLIYSKTYTHVEISGDHVGEYLGEGDCYGYVEDGWGGERSPSPIRYARPNSRGNLSSDTEDEDRRGVHRRRGETQVLSDTGSEVEFAEMDGDDEDEDDDLLLGGRRRRVWRRRSGDRGRGRGRGGETVSSRGPTTAAETTIRDELEKKHLSTPLRSPSRSLSPPAFTSSRSPSLSPSTCSSSSSANSYSNPYSTRKDRKRARRVQLRAFRNSYRMPPPPPSLELEEVDTTSVSASVSASARTETSKQKSKQKGAKPETLSQNKKKTSKSAIDYFNSVSASVVSASYYSSSQRHHRSSQSLSRSQSDGSAGSASASASASVSVMNIRTRTSSEPEPEEPEEPERGRKVYVVKKKTRRFAESVSLALEEVTNRGGRSGESLTLLPRTTTTSNVVHTNVEAEGQQQQHQTKSKLGNKNKKSRQQRPVVVASTTTTTTTGFTPSFAGGLFLKL